MIKHECRVKFLPNVAQRIKESQVEAVETFGKTIQALLSLDCKNLKADVNFTGMYQHFMLVSQN